MIAREVEDRYGFGTNTVNREEYLLKGNSSCPGCTAMLAIRHILKAAGPDTFVLVSACCAVVCEGISPNTCMALPTLDTAFACTAAMASGVRAAVRERGINVIAIAGDGGTVDIGVQALSGAIERNTDFLYVCYDNEAYGNTGMQRSGSTPFGASTTTTPFGKKEDKKDIAAIISAHNIPYMATACPSYPMDLQRKVKRALSIEGPKFLHVLTPCPPGWRISTEKAIEIGKLAVGSCSFFLYETENRSFSMSKPSLDAMKNPIPVKDYLRVQGRFSRMSEEDIEITQRKVDANIAYYREAFGL
ncbi:MAG: thiamine pyrophosphate-dependent enzyme [Candidatus Syntrophoarchaeum sp.]|nr:thiamine pyrophosphate-dependent enzyme [Candidatus Syntrophoarchaeum sp.]